MRALLLTLFSTYAFGQSYNMADLEKLIEQQSFQEAVTHLKDIPPMQRNKRWEKIAIAATLGQGKQIKKINSCRSAFWFISEQLKAYPVIKSNQKTLNLLASSAICTLTKEKGWHGRDDIAKKLLALDQRDQTIVELGLKTYYDSELKKRLLKNPSAFKKYPKIKPFILNRMMGTVELNSEKENPILVLVKEFELFKDKNSELSQMVTKSIKKDYDYAIKYGKPMSLSKEDKNFIYLARKYRLLSDKKLKKMDYLQEKGFLEFVYRYQSDFKENENVHQFLVNNWRKVRGDDPINKQLKSLILKYKLCQSEEYQEDLMHLKTIRKNMARSLKRYDAPGGYYGRSSSQKNVRDLKLAEQCQQLSTEDLGQFYFLTFLYDFPIRDKKKVNYLFKHAVDYLKALSKSERKTLSAMVEKHDLRDLFHAQFTATQEQIEQYLSLFPTLKNKAKLDCEYSLKDDTLGRKRVKKYRVSDRRFCEKFLNKE
jgi:hypothetical protein